MLEVPTRLTRNDVEGRVVSSVSAAAGGVWWIPAVRNHVNTKAVIEFVNPLTTESAENQLGDML